MKTQLSISLNTFKGRVLAFAFQFVMILNWCDILNWWDIMNLMQYYEGGDFSSEKIEFGLDVARFSTVWSLSPTSVLRPHTLISRANFRSKGSENKLFPKTSFLFFFRICQPFIYLQFWSWLKINSLSVLCKVLNHWKVSERVVNRHQQDNR